MSLAATSATIRGQFSTQWAILRPTVPIFYDSAGIEDAPKDSPWVRLTVVPGERFQVEMGNQRRWRQPGVVIVQIFVPTGVGEGLAQELADSVTTVYEGRTISGVIFRATTPQRIGIDGPWYQYNAITPFQSDDLS